MQAPSTSLQALTPSPSLSSASRLRSLRKAGQMLSSDSCVRSLKSARPKLPLWPRQTPPSAPSPGDPHRGRSP